MGGRLLLPTTSQALKCSPRLQPKHAHPNAHKHHSNYFLLTTLISSNLLLPSLSLFILTEGHRARQDTHCSPHLCHVMYAFSHKITQNLQQLTNEFYTQFPTSCGKGSCSLCVQNDAPSCEGMLSYSNCLLRPIKYKHTHTIKWTQHWSLSHAQTR